MAKSASIRDCKQLPHERVGPTRVENHERSATVDSQDMPSTLVRYPIGSFRPTAHSFATAKPGCEGIVTSRCL